MKKGIIGLIIGLSLGSIGVYAAYKYHANEVSYKNTNVESAINDLYSIIDAPITYKNIKSATITGSQGGTWTFHVESDDKIDVVVTSYGYTY